MSVDVATLRLAGEEDVPSLVALEDRWLAEDSTIGMVAVTAAQVRGWLGTYCWVAERGSEIVGFAYGRAENSEGLAVIPAGEPYLRIEELYVLPEYRDRGVGGRLLDQLLAEAAARGIARGRVYSSSRDWRRIIDFYQRHSFAMWYVELSR